jgi:type II restriction enzyme
MNRHITSPQDLETTHAAKRAGFLEIALRKNKEALPYIDEAKALKAIAAAHSTPQEMMLDLRTKGPLAEAAGISTKANAHLNQADIDVIVREFVTNFLDVAGDDFVDELVYRFLLSKGDALGGRMRNIVGAMAGEKLTRFLAANLRNFGYEHQFRLSKDADWIDSSDFAQEMTGLVKAIRWKQQSGSLRELIYNMTVPIVEKNIDISLFRGQTTGLISTPLKKAFFSDPANYLALGELKGGIDPAGADEHWKTGNSALGRIRSAFQAKNNPVHTFFVAAAIEVSMAREIFAQCSSGQLECAANLTNEEQLSELCAWLIAL